MFGMIDGEVELDGDDNNDEDALETCSFLFMPEKNSSMFCFNVLHTCVSQN